MSNNYVYVSNFYYNDISFNLYNATINGAALSTITLPGADNHNSNAFLAKYDTNGQAIWGTLMGGVNLSIGYDVFGDASGNIYVTGYYAGDTSFNLYNATINGAALSAITLPSAGGSVDGSGNAFLVKYDTNGQAVWGTIMGGVNQSGGTGVSVDLAGNIYVTGYYDDTSFNLYDASHNGAVKSEITLPSVGSDAFLVKYDTDGKALWGTIMGGVNLSAGYGVSLDSSGNSYVTGFYNDTSFNLYDASGNEAVPSLITLPSADGSDNVFLVKYDTNGQAIWGTIMGGVNLSAGYGVSLDSSGNSYVTGFYNDTSFNLYDASDNTAKPSLITLPSAGDGTDGSYNTFLVKYDTNGQAVWGTIMGGVNLSAGYGVSLDSSGNSYVTGFYNDTSFNLYDASINGATLSEITLPSADSNNNDAFLVKYNTDGQALWGTLMGGVNQSAGLGVSVDLAGNSYVTGRYTDTSFNLYDASGNTAALSNITLPTGGDGKGDDDNGDDTFLVKYNTNGKALWGTLMSGGDDALGGGVYATKFSIPPTPPTPPTPPPIESNICFPAGTPILTDQGVIPIDEINPDIHTICGKTIVEITKTVSFDKYLICFNKNALKHNYPTEKTIMSKEHKIYFNGKMREAKTFVDQFENVKKIKYNGEILYNVLMEEPYIIKVNNLICETLDPENLIAKLYTKNCKYSNEMRDEIVNYLKECLNKKDYKKYNKAIKFC